MLFRSRQAEAPGKGGKAEPGGQSPGLVQPRDGGQGGGLEGGGAGVSAPSTADGVGQPPAVGRQTEGRPQTKGRQRLGFLGPYMIFFSFFSLIYVMWVGPLYM